jgi:hypothetical protein
MYEGRLNQLTLRVSLLTGVRAEPDCTDKCASMMGDFIRLNTPAQVQGAVRPTRWLRTALAFCKVRRRNTTSLFSDRLPVDCSPEVALLAPRSGGLRIYHCRKRRTDSASS